LKFFSLNLTLEISSRVFNLA